MYTIGISIGHNGSTTLLKNGKVVLHIEEERLTRIKRDSEPFAGLLKIKEYTTYVDHLVISGSLELPKTFWSNMDYYTAVLNKSGVTVGTTVNAIQNHHVAHAANAFFNSGFEEASVIVIDGSGSKLSIGDKGEYGYEAESIFKYSYTTEPELLRGNMVTPYAIRSTNENNVSISQEPLTVKMYEGITSHLGWHPIEAGKTMGLAAYGKQNNSIPKFTVGNRGNLEYFTPKYPSSTTLTENMQCGTARSTDDKSDYTQLEKDLAWAMQDASEDLCEALVRETLELSDSKNICISGGYGLNVVNNYKLTTKFPEVNFYFEPTCNDAGNSIGIAKQVYYDETGDKDGVQGISNYYLGFDYNFATADIPEKLHLTRVGADKVAELIAKNNIVAIYQGKSEAGPRALGNRSFMYNPIGINSKDEMNRVKRREWFRPFAASVLTEHADEYFEMTVDESPHMMIAFPTREEKKKKIPGVVHVDGTTRIQTVSQEDNKYYREVIEEFYNLTGVPMIMNTSFNLAGEPLVETPTDALKTLIEADFGYLYIPEERLLISKGEVQ